MPEPQPNPHIAENNARNLPRDDSAAIAQRVSEERFSEDVYKDGEPRALDHCEHSRLVKAALLRLYKKLLCINKKHFARGIQLCERDNPYAMQFVAYAPGDAPESEWLRLAEVLYLEDTH